MIINPQISIPPDVSVRDPIKASTTNGILSALRQERTPKQLSTRLKNVFDLYSFMPFCVTMNTPHNVSVTGGNIYVHARAASPYFLSALSNFDLSVGGAWSSGMYICAQFTWGSSSTSWTTFTLAGPPTSTASNLVIPIALYTRYGTSAADYGYSLTQVLHVGDIHVCKAFAATT